MKAIVQKQKLFELVDGLIEKNTPVFAPVREETQAVYRRIRSSKEIVWQGVQTVLPPKFLPFPQQETLLTYKFNDRVEISPVVEAEESVVMGAHSCDINALYLLDLVFSEKNPDENYLKRREKVTVIGFECLEPCSEESFCFRKQSILPWGGYDAFLTDLGDRFFVDIASERGEKLLSGALDEPGEEDRRKLAEVRRKRDELFDAKQKKLLPKLEELPELLWKNYSSKVWEERGEKCLECGSCNIVCPTCYCFDVRDYADLSLQRGERMRVWDGCMLTEFTRVATGEVFRHRRADRLRHRTYRKDLYLTEKWKRTFCTGCGRCGTACLVKIVSPIDIANDLHENTNGGNNR